MAISAYDAQVFVWKMLKISTTTCVHVSKKHPYVTSCLFFLSILYIYFPLFFWILIYSLPLAVSTWVVLNIRDGRRCKDESEIEREIERELKERESGGKLHKQTKFATKDSVEKGKGKKIKKAYSRVHSVRRRRAKEMACGDDSTHEGKSRASEFNGDHDATDEDDEMEEEKHALLLSTDSNTDTVDRTTMVDGSPKEIHEVGENFPLANAHVGPDVSIDHEIYHNPEIDRSLKLLKDEGDARDEASKAMDVNIAEDETNKRLESLIARRRSQKMINPPVRKSLVNLDHATFGSGSGSGPQMPPIVIPKINTWCSPSKVSGPFSPGPGSAPSVLIPMRNPFDLPYDPQEEKLDLTGDSFQQEFASGHMPRDFTFCRHESFSLGPSLPMDFFEDRDDTSSVDDFGFRRRRSSYGFQFSKPETEESDTDFGATTEAESGVESETKSNIDSPNSDQIKEVIQVHENGTQSHSAEEARVGPSKHNTRRNALDELSLSSNSSGTGSTGSSEGDERPPICKINREAILKSLSMRRNSVSVPDIEMEGNEQLQENNLSYANSALENASRLKQQYFADKPQKRHGMTFSIASDMQVEVSELSSPPLTIGENMSYQDDASAYDTELERNTSWDGLDSWAGSSRLSESRLSEVEDNETRLTRANEVGASRSRKCDDTSLPRSVDTEKHCITSSSSASELSESQASDLHEKVAQTTSPETIVGEEPPASEDAKVASSEATIENNVQTTEPAQRVEGEHETSSNQDAMDSTSLPQEQPAERVHHATISPKSVLQPTLSVASFEHEGDDEARLSAAHPVDHLTSNAPQNSTPLAVQFTVGTSSNGAAEAPQNIQGNDERQKEVIVGSSSKMMQIHENSAQTRDKSSSSRSLTSNVDTNDTETVNGKMKIQENNDHLKEAAGGSTSKALEINEASPKTREESSSRSLTEAEIHPISSLSNENETAIQESTRSEVEDRDTYESHMTNEADEEAQQRANSQDGEAK